MGKGGLEIRPHSAIAAARSRKRNEAIIIELKILMLCPMSALGQKQSFSQCNRNVCFIPDRYHAATRSISAGSSLGARELFTRRETGQTCK